MYWTRDDVARAFIAEGRRRDVTERGIVICIATGLVETQLVVYANPKVPESMRLPHDAVGSDGMSVGPLQQQVRKGDSGRWWWADAATSMDPTKSAGLFYDRLTLMDYNSPARTPGYYAQMVQQSAFPLRYDQRMSEAQRIYDRLTGGTVPAVTGDPVWLEDVLREALGARLKVETDWATRGTGDGWNGTDHMGPLWGVMIHHTGNRNESVAVIRDGRPDLAGPLSQCLIKPDGICHLIAIGPCNHGGAGSYPGITNANQQLIGFECAWPTIRANGSYNAAERWPDAQIITMRDATAAVLKKLGAKAERVIGHKEWAGASQGKWDPGNLDMNWFRGEVQKDLDGFVFPGEGGTTTPQPGPILPPDYSKEIYDQLRVEWRQLGGQTLVNAVAEMRDKVCGTTDYANWKAGK